jgi:copper chaperone
MTSAGPAAAALGVGSASIVDVNTLEGYSLAGAHPMSECTYTVPEMRCSHCTQAVCRELMAVAGVESVEVDLDSKFVTVHGAALDDRALRAAIEEAGYEAE